MQTDKFTQAQLSFSNIISSNMENLTGDIETFSQRMEVSKSILQEIGKQAQEFSLSPKALADSTKLLSAMLVPKGLAGTNFKTAIDMSRNLLKSAPNLGIDPNEVQGQLLRAIEGHGSLGDTLLRRLSAETSAFSDLQGGGKRGSIAAFNNQTAAKRVEILSKALQQFAKDADVLSGRVNTVTGQLENLNNVFQDYITSILKPMGEVLQKPVVEVLKTVNAYLRKEGSETVKIFADFLKPIVEDPKNLLINIMQARKLGKDVADASLLTEIIAITTGVRILLNTFPKLKMAVAGVLPESIFTALTSLRGMFMLMGTGLVKILPWLGYLAGALLRLVPQMAAFVALFQIFSRAQAKADTMDAQAALEMAPQYLRLAASIKTSLSMIFSPFTEFFDLLADGIGSLLSWSFWIRNASGLIEFFADSLRFLANGVMLAKATLSGIFWAIFQFIKNLNDLIHGKLVNPFSGLRTQFNFGIDDMIQRSMDAMKKGDLVSNVHNNIGKVEINNNFKEKMEPDRIAFSLKSQLLKAAANPTRARGQVFDYSSAVQGAK